MIELIIGIIIGIVLLPFIIAFYPSNYNCTKKTREYKLKTSSDTILSNSQAELILKSLNQCKDLNWLNVLLLKFWCELSKSTAQAYRLKQFIKKCLDDIPGTGIIRSIDVINVNIGTEGPIIQSIKILTANEAENIKKTNVESQSFKMKNGMVNCAKIYREIFQNVNSLISFSFKGSIKIDLKIGFPKGLILHTVLYINEITGDVLIRFPSINHSTRLEYTFISNPKISMVIDGGLSKGESGEYFKQSISTLIHRTVKYSIFKMLVYPIFNTLYLPIIVPNISQVEHKIEKITTENFSCIDLIKESILMILAMDFKKTEVVNDIIYKHNNLLINNKEKIYCAQFPISDCALNLSNIVTEKIFLYENLTVKESKFMSQIYDLSIFKNVISNFLKINLLHTFDLYTSLIEIVFTQKKIEFVRIIIDEMIIFQRNDEQNPDFLVFYIRNQDLLIYSFVTSSLYKMTKSRISKLKQKLEMKKTKKPSLNRLFTYSKNVFSFWKKKNDKLSSICVKEIKNVFTDEENESVNRKILDIMNTPITKMPSLTYNFNCEAKIIFNILMENDVRVKFFSNQSKNCTTLHKNEIYTKLMIKNNDQTQDDFIIYTFTKGNLIYDFFDEKKIIFEINDYKNIAPSCLTPELTNKIEDKNTKILFINDNHSYSSFNNRLSDLKQSVLNIYVDTEVCYSTGNSFYESIFIRMRQQEIINLSEKYDFEQLQMTKEIKKDFFGSIGGVYIEIRTLVPDIFILTLYSSNYKKSILSIKRVITSRPIKLIVPLTNDDILLLKLIPRYKKNDKIDIRIINLPEEYHRESLIDFNIEMLKNESFCYPVNGSPDYIIFWEKDKDDTIKGLIESPYSKVPIHNNGTMRTDKMNYSLVYKNKNKKRRDLKIFMGITKK